MGASPHLKLKSAFSDGTSHLVLTFDELLQRLCALVPRPGTHRVRYHGVLAPAAKDRSKVVPLPDKDLAADDLALQATSPCIDSASESALPNDSSDLDGDGDLSEPIPFDLANNARVVDIAGVDGCAADATCGVVDMGAYERQP